MSNVSTLEERWKDLTPSQQRLLVSELHLDGKALFGGRGSGNSYRVLRRKGIVYREWSDALAAPALWHKLTKEGKKLRSYGMKLRAEKERKFRQLQKTAEKEREVRQLQEKAKRGKQTMSTTHDDMTPKQLELEARRILPTITKGQRRFLAGDPPFRIEGPGGARIANRLRVMRIGGHGMAQDGCPTLILSPFGRLLREMIKVQMGLKGKAR